ncbi:hotdog fold thioesterase [Faecalibacter sp. LW9]|uniref:PaaI family thioesterase n=1 Tax=Faecalibacter sp. LW9 TaxID=3103144 RepID=UPI002B000BC6|nr:hotdog fold thioesterase [Faecalibacter sp. LW9]
MSKEIVSQLNKMSENTLISHLNIKFTEAGEDYLKASMPVSSIVHQPFGMLHGGASVVLAESLGSSLSNYILNDPRYVAVGQQIDANHLRSKTSGTVYGHATVVKKGRTSHLIKIEITDEHGKLICYSHLTNAIIPNPHAK